MAVRIVSSGKVERSVRRAAEEAEKRCEEFFGTAEDFTVIVCHSAKEFRKAAKYYHVAYATGLTLRNRKIVVKSPTLIAAEGRWERREFTGIVTHEMVHAAWYARLGAWTPNWLSEGVACVVAKQFFLSKTGLRTLLAQEHVNFRFIDFRYLPKKIGTHTIDRYRLWSNFTRYLVQSKGKTRLLAFLEKYAQDTSKRNYEGAFETVFGKSVKDTYEEWTERLYSPT